MKNPYIPEGGRRLYLHCVGGFNKIEVKLNAYMHREEDADGGMLYWEKERYSFNLVFPDGGKRSLFHMAKEDCEKYPMETSFDIGRRLHGIIDAVRHCRR